MNKKQWSGLLMVYISYLLLGATIFYYIENRAEEISRKQQFDDYKFVTEKIKEKFEHDEELSHFVNNLSDYCGKNFEFDKTMDNFMPRLWNYYNSFFFVVTVVSTIGYGNVHPTNDLSRLLMILYAVIGIPLNGILLSSLAQFFGAVFHRAHKNYKTKPGREGPCALTVTVLTYLTPGLIIFIFLPAAMVSYLEQWDYIESVYYAFVTLTTIGFGDLVAGQADSYPELYSPILVVVYKIVLCGWVIFGLGYLLMLLGFVAQGMQNKKLLVLEEKLVNGLTHSKMWNTFAKDIGYIRRLVNELHLDKVKPVFREKEFAPPVIHKSKSLPDLLQNDEEQMRLRLRQRAMSMQPNKVTLPRVFSETDLTRIDRNATFAATNTVPTAFELVRRVIDVYTGGQLRDWSEGESDEGLRGYDGFSDEQVLSSENWSNPRSNISRHPSSVFNVPSYEDTVSRQPHRGRAMSECPPPDHGPVLLAPSTTTENPADWTWSGPNANKLHDMIKQRQKQKMLMGLNKGRKISLSSSIITGAKKMMPRNRRRCVTENNSQENNLHSGNSIGFGQPPISKHNFSDPVNVGHGRKSFQDIRESFQVNPSHYMTHTGANILNTNPQKMFSRDQNPNRKDILEQTSVADFLRVLTDLHSRVGERLVATESQPKPRRKMGTASLTPPRIRSLLELFPGPNASNSPKPNKRRKPSKITNLFSADKCTPSTTAPESADKPAEPSNLRRLGRFLLRSYSIVPKDVEAKSSFRKKRFSLWPTDTEESPPFQLQVDSPSTITEVSITIDPEELETSLPVVVATTVSPVVEGPPGLLFPVDQSGRPNTSQSLSSTSPVLKKKDPHKHWLLDDPPSDTHI